MQTGFRSFSRNRSRSVKPNGYGPHGFKNGMLGSARHYDDLRVSLKGLNALHAYGDSITVGLGSTVTAEGYIQQFAARKGLTLSNHAVGARGLWNQCSNIQLGAWTPAETLITIMVGLNDMKRNGSATKTLNKFDSALRAMIFKCIRGATQYSQRSILEMIP
jgi:hypothetical protein